MHFLLDIILSALDKIQKLGIVLILLYRIPYFAKILGFSSIYIFGGRGNLMAHYLSVGSLLPVLVSEFR